MVRGVDCRIWWVRAVFSVLRGTRAPIVMGDGLYGRKCVVVVVVVDKGAAGVAAGSVSVVVRSFGGSGLGCLVGVDLFDCLSDAIRVMGTNLS